jgi:hypothetical protein
MSGGCTIHVLVYQNMCRVIHKSLRYFRNRLPNNQDRHSRKDISSTCKVGQNLGVSLPLLTCSPSAWPSRLLYRRCRTFRTDLWITLYLVKISNWSPLFSRYFVILKSSFYDQHPWVRNLISCSPCALVDPTRVSTTRQLRCVIGCQL